MTKREIRQMILGGVIGWTASLLLLGVIVYFAARGQADQPNGIWCAAQGDTHKVAFECEDHATGEKKRYTERRNFKDHGVDADRDGKNDLLGKRRCDDEGNCFECWCLQAHDDPARGALANQMYYRWIDSTGKEEWIGSCFFGNGFNMTQAPGEVDPKKKGKVKKFKKFEQINVNGPPGPGMFTDYHFIRYNETTKSGGEVAGKCRRNRTRGTFKSITPPVYAYETVPPPGPLEDCPRGAGGVHPPPEPVGGVDDGHPGGGHDWQQTVLIADVSFYEVDGRCRYCLKNASFFLDGWGVRAGIEQFVAAGDKIFVGGAGLRDPEVVGNASEVDYGGWFVSEAADDFVVFEAAYAAEMPLDVPIGYFEVAGDGRPLGRGWWAFQGAAHTENGSVVAPGGDPIPPPPTNLRGALAWDHPGGGFLVYRAVDVEEWELVAGPLMEREYSVPCGAAYLVKAVGWNGAVSEPSEVLAVTCVEWRRRGDADDDGRLNLTDVILIWGFLFFHDPAQLPCWDAADVNWDGRLDVSDGRALCDWLFMGGPAPMPVLSSCPAGV